MFHLCHSKLQFRRSQGGPYNGPLSLYRAEKPVAVRVKSTSGVHNHLRVIKMIKKSILPHPGLELVSVSILVEKLHSISLFSNCVRATYKEGYEKVVLMSCIF